MKMAIGILIACISTESPLFAGSYLKSREQATVGGQSEVRFSQDFYAPAF
jgi:hypothetical protein